MTIKIEQQTLLRVLDRQAANAPLLDSTIPRGRSDDFVLVDFAKPLGADFAVEKLGKPTCTADDLLDDDSDTLSTSSLSTADSSDCCDDSIIERRVSFAQDVVTEEWVRPFTPKEEISNLFYSTEETSRFRQEYRLERKLLSELSIDPDSFSAEDKDLSALVATPSTGNQAYRISRVVVLHNDKLETFVDNDIGSKSNGDDSNSLEQQADDFSFDNDSFWSGSITWY